MSKKYLFYIAASVLGVSAPVGNLSAMALGNVKTAASTNLIYRQKKALNEAVNTFEAWVKLPSSLPSDVPGGVIAGSFFNTAEGYPGSTDFCIGRNGTFDVFWNFKARVSEKPTFEAKFSFNDVDLRNDTWTHVAFVRDAANSEVRYYVNGVLKNSQSIALSDNITTYPYGFGADWANWYIDVYERDRSPFQGEISQVVFNKNVLSQAEIADDMDNVIPSDRDGLLGNWVFGKRTEASAWGDKEEIVDGSNRKDNLELVSFNNTVPVEEVNDFDYSFVIVPDQQAMCYAPHGKRDNWIEQSQWIIDNKEKEKIAFVSYLGDMTESNFSKGGSDAASSSDEYIFASACMGMLEDEVPYTFVLGNHDYDNWLRNNRNTTQYNKYFPSSKFLGRNPFYSYMVDVFEEGKMDNYYSLISVCGIDYLIFALEQCPRDIVINWVSRVIQENPLKRVILTTHSYMTPNGHLTDSTSTLSPAKTITYEDCNVGEKMFDKLVSKHPNILAVFCGHECTDEVVYRTDKGDYGNTVHSILIDAQGSMLTNCMNTLLLVKVNEKNKTMSLCYYWPTMDACFLKQNQFTISFADKYNPSIN